MLYAFLRKNKEFVAFTRWSQVPSLCNGHSSLYIRYVIGLVMRVSRLWSLKPVFGSASRNNVCCLQLVLVLEICSLIPKLLKYKHVRPTLVSRVVDFVVAKSDWTLTYYMVYPRVNQTEPNNLLRTDEATAEVIKTTGASRPNNRERINKLARVAGKTSRQ